jgi:hypothetical protein
MVYQTYFLAESFLQTSANSRQGHKKHVRNSETYHVEGLPMPTPKNAQNPEKTKKQLSEITNYFSSEYLSKTKTLAFIASKLRGLVRKKSWGWSYLHQIDSGSLKPRIEISMAIDALYKEVKSGKKPLVLIVVQGDGSTLDPFTIVTGSSKLCARADCDEKFVPNSPNHRFCTSRCRRIAYKQKGKT